MRPSFHDFTIDMAADDSAANPERAAMCSGESKSLTKAVAELPLVFREVLILRELEKVSYRKIASIADISIGTAMFRLTRAAATLAAFALNPSAGRAKVNDELQ